MQNIVHILAGPMAGRTIPDVAVDEGKILPLICGNQGADFIQIVLIAGGEIVQADYLVIFFEQGFQEIGADEAGNACY
jgi:hypothetical protein